MQVYRLIAFLYIKISREVLEVNRFTGLNHTLNLTLKLVNVQNDPQMIGYGIISICYLINEIVLVRQHISKLHTKTGSSNLFRSLCKCRCSNECFSL